METLSGAERVDVTLFFIRAFTSLENSIVRAQVLRLCSLPLLHHVPEKCVTYELAV